MAKSRYNEIYYRKIKKAPPRNVYMERFFEHLEGGLKNYAVNTCCLLFPLRKGLLIIGYFNIFLEMIFIIGAATDTISTLFMKIQEGFADSPSKSVGVAIPTIHLASIVVLLCATHRMILIVGTATDTISPVFTKIQQSIGDEPPPLPKAIEGAIPTTEFVFSIVLLCATHRNDVGLLRFYMVYGCVAIGLTVVSYAIVMVSLSLFFVFALIASVAYQAYILLLVRSLIVKIRQAKCEVRMMSLKELLNRKEIDVESPPPAPVHRPLPKDAGPGPLAAIVGNPQVEIVVKSEHTDANNVKTVAEIKKETKEITEEVKKSNIVIKNKKAVNKLSKKTNLTDEVKVEGPLKEKDPKASGEVNAKLSFLGMKKIETNKGKETDAKEESKDKDPSKQKKTIFRSKPVDTPDISDKGNKDVAETTEKTKPKKEGKQKKRILGIKRKDTNKIKDLSKNELGPEFLEAEDQEPGENNINKKQTKDMDKNLYTINEDTRVVIETKTTNSDTDNIIKNDTVQTCQKESKIVKEKRIIQKGTKETNEMEEIELNVDTGTECKGNTKLEKTEQPRKKWFWKK